MSEGALSLRNNQVQNDVFTEPFQKRAHGWHVLPIFQHCLQHVLQTETSSTLALPLKLKFPEPYNESYVELISGTQ